MIQRVTGLQRSAAAQVQPKQGGGQGAFGALLQQELSRGVQRQPAQSVAFSKHAISRAQQLAGSVVRAQAKGATNILAMDAEKAFIINVPSAKVITAITQDEMKENIFTNIDGAVFL